MCWPTLLSKAKLLAHCPCDLHALLTIKMTPMSCSWAGCLRRLPSSGSASAVPRLPKKPWSAWAATAMWRRAARAPWPASTARCRSTRFGKARATSWRWTCCARCARATSPPRWCASWPRPRVPTPHWTAWPRRCPAGWSIWPPRWKRAAWRKTWRWPCRPRCCSRAHPPPYLPHFVIPALRATGATPLAPWAPRWTLTALLKGPCHERYVDRPHPPPLPHLAVFGKGAPGAVLQTTGLEVRPHPRHPAQARCAGTDRRLPQDAVPANWQRHLLRQRADLRCAGAHPAHPDAVPRKPQGRGPRAGPVGRHHAVLGRHGLQPATQGCCQHV